ncbi:hypothetical protein QUF76_12700 [Desulfobacterales bacterium HSG16]|nr:hypothetical protein [Desulfobacterales bacterium HSG16]
MNDLITMLPGRFQYHYMENMPENECLEMIFKYAVTDGVPITEETAYLMARLTEGNPFYISSVFRSKYHGKDFSTEKGLRKTLEFETLNREGIIRGTWLEYINSAFPRINDKYAKNIVLYLSKHKNRFVSRTELKKNLELDMPDHKLDKKMDSLLKSDIIEEDRFQYRGVQDNIFDKVFRSRYADDIDKFEPEDVLHEYKAMFDELLEKYKKLSGRYNRYKGAFAEFMIIRHLEDDAFCANDFFKSMMKNLPEDFNFLQYKSVWSYNSPPLHSSEFQIDIFAEASAEKYSMIGEIKNRKAKFSIKEAEEFRKKAEELVKLENPGKIILFVFSTGGFFKNTRQYLKKHGIAWSSDKRWLDRMH